MPSEIIDIGSRATTPAVVKRNAPGTPSTSAYAEVPRSDEPRRDRSDEVGVDTAAMLGSGWVRARSGPGDRFGPVPRMTSVTPAPLPADAAPYDALLVVSFGGPEAPEDVVPFLENVTRG